MQESAFPRYLARAAFSFKARLEERFQGLGYPITMPQWVLLHVLKHRDGIQQKEIARRSFKDKTNVARILSALDEQGLVTRQIDPDDQRSYQVFLTDKGRHLESKLQALVSDVMGLASAGIPKSDLQCTLNTLLQLYQNLSET